MFPLLHLFWRISSPLSENAAFAAQKRACLSKFACRTHFSIPQYDIHEKVKFYLFIISHFGMIANQIQTIACICNHINSNKKTMAYMISSHMP
jgi:hypothetical protein